jgi:Zn-finger nucleic acid-binding protein
MSDDALTCPQCGTEMSARPLGSGLVHSCPQGHGVFLARMDLGSYVESESDWHRLASQGTQPIPRITRDMTAPPTAKIPARAWVETLFS